MSNTVVKIEDWARCVTFHGHECPGLAIGFRVAQAGLNWIKSNRAEDEEVVAVVETDACSVDAVQVLTGCTFGKGNLIYKDYGKQAFTFFNRNTGQSSRFSLKSGVIPQDPRYRELMMKSREGNASQEELAEMTERRETMMQAILTKPLEELFAVSGPHVTLPDKARVQRSESCASCGEPTMPLKMVEKNGMKYCRPCAEKID